MRFYITQDQVKQIKQNNQIIITNQDLKHIKTVLRLKTGDKISLFDSLGHEYNAQISNFAKNQVQIIINSQYKISELNKSLNTESFLDITIGQAILKGDKMDNLIRYFTELGISRLIPFFSERSIINSKTWKPEKILRWQKISQESIKQCRRFKALEILNSIDICDILQKKNSEDNSEDNYDLRILFWENEINNKLSSVLDKNKISKVLIVLGPEGGFTSQEVCKAQENNFEIVSLGPRILKADTASILAAGLIQYIWGDIGNSPCFRQDIFTTKAKV